MKNGELLLKRLVLKEIGLDISRKQLRVFLKEYNDFKLPLSKAVEEIIYKPDTFTKFVLDRTDIPIKGTKRFKRYEEK